MMPSLSFSTIRPVHESQIELQRDIAKISSSTTTWIVNFEPTTQIVWMPALVFADALILLYATVSDCWRLAIWGHSTANLNNIKPKTTFGSSCVNLQSVRPATESGKVEWLVAVRIVVPTDTSSWSKLATWKEKRREKKKRTTIDTLTVKFTRVCSFERPCCVLQMLSRARTLL